MSLVSSGQTALKSLNLAKATQLKACSLLRLLLAPRHGVRCTSEQKIPPVLWGFSSGTNLSQSQFVHLTQPSRQLQRSIERNTQQVKADLILMPSTSGKKKTHTSLIMAEKTYSSSYRVPKSAHILTTGNDAWPEWRTVPVFAHQSCQIPKLCRRLPGFPHLAVSLDRAPSISISRHPCSVQ